MKKLIILSLIILLVVSLFVLSITKEDKDKFEKYIKEDLKSENIKIKEDKEENNGVHRVEYVEIDGKEYQAIISNDKFNEIMVAEK